MNFMTFSGEPPLYENVEDFASFPDTDSASLEFSLMNSFLRNLPPPPPPIDPEQVKRGQRQAANLAPKQNTLDVAADFRMK